MIATKSRINQNLTDRRTLILAIAAGDGCSNIAPR
jgi:hypothetical protein